MQGSGIRNPELSNHTGRLLAATALASVLALAGCRQDMHDQPKFQPQRGTTFFADGRSARPQVAGTVARSQLHQDTYFYTGMNAGAEGTTMPFPVTMQVLERGQERYNVYCTPCHSRVGNGAGMIVQRGYSKAGNFHTARLQSAPLGHFFSVISNGYGSMPDYAAQLTPADRWAVVAYIKALQMSQNAQPGDVPAGEHVQSLSDISVAQGLPSGFAAEWALPQTAVSGTPDNDLYVIPPGSVTNGSGANGIPGQPVPGSGAATPPPSGQSSTGYPNAAIPPGPPK